MVRCSRMVEVARGGYKGFDPFLGCMIATHGRLIVCCAIPFSSTIIPIYAVLAAWRIVSG